VKWWKDPEIRYGLKVGMACALIMTVYVALMLSLAGCHSTAHKRCHVATYTRKDGTRVNGYDRDC
jgi:hypothetical protein